MLNGFLRIADETMAGAIRKISTARGYDPAEFAMVAFGGAGGMHACSIARLLNISTVLVPGDAGLLSAYGIGNAVFERFAERQVLRALDEAGIHSLLPDLEREAREKMADEGIRDGDVQIRGRLVFMRFRGQESTIEVNWENPAQVKRDFREAYTTMYGHWSDERVIEVESVRVVASSPAPAVIPVTEQEPAAKGRPVTPGTGGYPVYSRQRLDREKEIAGPAIITDPYSTTFLEEGWSCRKNGEGTLVLKRHAGQTETRRDAVAPEAELELFSRRFMGIAENMGAMLQHTSVSVNVKERLDFSCAVVDTDGYLVANAPHIPVHLGSLGICVRTLLRHAHIQEGDTLVTNHPAFGGSHLPDITLVTPVHTGDGRRIGFMVNRAHHAEIGGISPGSMPPRARSLAEEGVVIKPFYLVKRGVADWEGMEKLLSGGPYPSRAVSENLADLNGALAANRKGAADLLQLVDHQGFEKVTRYMELLREHACRKTTEALQRYPLAHGSALELLDDGTPLVVEFRQSGGKFILDFQGTGGVHPGNLNANPAIVYSVIMYVMRLLLEEEIPLNDGMLDPVRVELPPGLLNPPFPDDPALCPALVGGNVEVSQRLTDTLLKALKLQSASQGTMNNVLFGS